MGQFFAAITGTLGIIIFILAVLFVSIMTAWLSGIKGYNPGAWFVLGLFGGLISLITIGLAPNKNNLSKDIEKLKKLIEPISLHYKEKKDKETKAEMRKKEENLEKEERKRKESIKTMEELLNDETIKKESDMMLKMYGKDAQERYLQGKIKEFKIDPK